MELRVGAREPAEVRRLSRGGGEDCRSCDIRSDSQCPDCYTLSGLPASSMRGCEMAGRRTENHDPKSGYRRFVPRQTGATVPIEKSELNENMEFAHSSSGLQPGAQRTSFVDCRDW